MKRKHLPLQVKYDALKAMERGEPKVRIAERLGMPLNTVCMWTRPDRKEKIINAVECGTYNPHIKNMKPGSAGEVDEALLIWLRETRASGFYVSGTDLKAKALFFAEKFGLPDFKASTGWLDRFKARHGLVQHHPIQENSTGAPQHPQETVQLLRSVALPDVLSEFKLCDIYNADDPRFFVFPQHKELWTSSINSGHRMKVSKESVTVLFAANADGSDKREPLVIGKQQSPRCFKGKVLPCPYDANSKAWLTSDIWERWLRSWDRQLAGEKRKIALIVDKMPGHLSVRLENITLFYLPANTVQPMDMGITAKVKFWYRSIFSFEHLIPALASKYPIDFNVYKALSFVVGAWGNVSPRTLRLCFRKAGFGDAQEEEEEEEEEEENVGPFLSELAARMSVARGAEITKEDVRRFLTTQEEDFPAPDELDEDDMVTDGNERNAEASDEEEELDIVSEERPSIEEYLKATEVCQSFWMLAEPSEATRKGLAMTATLKVSGILQPGQQTSPRPVDSFTPS